MKKTKSPLIDEYFDTCCNGIIAGSLAFEQAWGRLGQIAFDGTAETPWGTSSPIAIFENGHKRIAIVFRHGRHSHHILAHEVNHRANIWALKSLGVDRCIAWTGPGAISPKLFPGSLVRIVDILDFTKNRPSSFFSNTGMGFIRSSPISCPEIENIFVSEASVLPEVVYAVTEGPRLETTAEIRALSLLGAHVVGMSLAPEIFLARELEICYFPLGYITNWAEGVKKSESKPQELFGGMLPREFRNSVKSGPQRILDLIIPILENFPRNRKCPCSKSLDRYRKMKILPRDFRDWPEVRRGK